MKDSYDKKIQLHCKTCNYTKFEFDNDKTWAKCTRCGREYNGGYSELVELNQETIDQELENTKEEILNDIKSDIQNAFEKSLKGNKFLRFKK